VNRAHFVKTVAAGAAAAAFLRQTALTSAAGASESGPIAKALVETIFPIGTRGFPDISSGAIVARMNAIFNLDGNAVFTASLQSFNRVADFSVPSSQTMAIDRATMTRTNASGADVPMNGDDAGFLTASGVDVSRNGVTNNGSSVASGVNVNKPSAIDAGSSAFADRTVNKGGSVDAAAFAASGLAVSRAFVDLEPSARIVYLSLWQHSALNVRRRFYQSVRAIAFSTLYSMPESWNAIGYAGPLIGRGK
jgi:hypothetical protein